MNKKIYLAVIGLLAILVAGSYFSFLSYTPKTLHQIANVKGYKTNDGFLLAYPTDGREISIDQTDSGKQVTLETSKSPDEVQRFYRNIFTSKGWIIENTGSGGGFLSTKYKKDNSFISVSASKQDGDQLTIVVISELKK